MDSIENAEDVVLYSDKPFVPGDDSDECEEEVDDESDRELDAFQKSLPDEYEDDTQYQEALAAAEVEEDGETDFFGFSDSDDE